MPRYGTSRRSRPNVPAAQMRARAVIAARASVNSELTVWSALDNVGVGQNPSHTADSSGRS
jgi:hypothetical protein